MAITYPRDLPIPCKVWAATIDLADNVAGAVSGGGKVNLTQVDDPIWRISVRTGVMTPGEVAAWSAWKSSLRGGLRSFITYDTRRLAPLAYPTAKAPADISAGWGGTATVATLGSSGALSLSGLPAGYKISAGDRIGLEQGSPLRRGYYEALEDVTANGTGAATVTVAPFLHTAILSTSATARLWRPKAEFIIDWTSWREEEADVPKYASVSFEAWQKL